ncbi:MAG: hypothetical protein E5V63_03855 [Mesorhizobium sp.]|nr:MAG: hypothetical protein E5V63_03855 [Mesorhizobium sp.]
MDTSTTLDISAAALKRAQKLRDENDRFRVQAAAELARARELIADIAELMDPRAASGAVEPRGKTGEHGPQPGSLAIKLTQDFAGRAVSQKLGSRGKGKIAVFRGRHNRAKGPLASA